MEGDDYTYVNGHDGYSGNILLDPDGYVTRAELYDVMAEAGRPVNVTVEPSSLEVGAAAIAYTGFALLVMIAVASLVAAIRRRRAK